MLKKIKNILRYINEESLESFWNNKKWIEILIEESIKEQQSSSNSFDESMALDFFNNAGYIEQLREELEGEDVDIDSLRYYDTDILIPTNTYKEFIHEQMEDRLNSIVIYIEDNIINSDGTINLFRAIKIPNDRYPYQIHLEEQGKHLGVFWADSFDKAEAYWGQGGILYILETQVREEHVDWYGTLLARLDLTLGDEEQEIRLFKGTPIKILSLYNGDTGKKLDISSIKDKIFYA